MIGSSLACAIFNGALTYSVDSRRRALTFLTDLRSTITVTVIPSTVIVRGSAAVISTVYWRWTILAPFRSQSRDEASHRRASDLINVLYSDEPPGPLTGGVRRASTPYQWAGE